MILSYYPYSNQDDVLVQPQSIKYRAAFRSPMSSFRWNQHFSQFLYDITVMYKNLEEIESKYSDYTSYLEERATAPISAQLYDTTLDIPALVNVDIQSINSVSSKLEALDKRLKALEMRRNA